MLRDGFYREIIEVIKVSHDLNNKNYIIKLKDKFFLLFRG